MDSQSELGKLLAQARQAAGLTRMALGQLAGIEPSYLYRLETGERKPSREKLIDLAEGLQADAETANRWLNLAGYAAVPLPDQRIATRTRGVVRSRAAVRTRGAMQPSGVPPRSEKSAGESTLLPQQEWKTWLNAMGLQQATIARMLSLLEFVTPESRAYITRSVAAAFTHVIHQMETPVSIAIIPAAGREHRILAGQMMERLILRAILEAVASGISEIILVLGPGSEGLSRTLSDMFRLAIVPRVRLHIRLQPAPAGLGDAILLAEDLVGKRKAAVLLPDDLLRPRDKRTAVPDWTQMVDTFARLNDDRASMIAVTNIPQSSLSRYGVAQVDDWEKKASGQNPLVRKMLSLVEKPRPGDAILRHSRGIYGIIGRYILNPDIFRELRRLQGKKLQTLELTDAIESLRQNDYPVYAFRVAARRREDFGEILTSAGDLVGEL